MVEHFEIYETKSSYSTNMVSQSLWYSTKFQFKGCDGQTIWEKKSVYELLMTPHLQTLQGNIFLNVKKTTHP